MGFYSIGPSKVRWEKGAKEHPRKLLVQLGQDDPSLLASALLEREKAQGPPLRSPYALLPPPANVSQLAATKV
jgi:hypothetical protein